eukprot:Pgem_evm1s19526
MFIITPMILSALFFSINIVFCSVCSATQNNPQDHYQFLYYEQILIHNYLEKLETNVVDYKYTEPARGYEEAFNRIFKLGEQKENSKMFYPQMLLDDIETLYSEMEKENEKQKHFQASVDTIKDKVVCPDRYGRNGLVGFVGRITGKALSIPFSLAILIALREGAGMNGNYHDLAELTYNVGENIGELLSHSIFNTFKAIYHKGEYVTVHMCNTIKGATGYKLFQSEYEAIVNNKELLEIFQIPNKLGDVQSMEHISIEDSFNNNCDYHIEYSGPPNYSVAPLFRSKKLILDGKWHNAIIYNTVQQQLSDQSLPFQFVCKPDGQQDPPLLPNTEEEYYQLLKQQQQQQSSSASQSSSAPPNTNTEAEAEECIICLERLDAEPAVITNCKHKYHKSCLDNHLALRQNCPMCRAEVSSSTYKFFKSNIVQPIVNSNTAGGQLYTPSNIPALINNMNRKYHQPVAWQLFYRKQKVGDSDKVVYFLQQLGDKHKPENSIHKRPNAYPREIRGSIVLSALITLTAVVGAKAARALWKFAPITKIIQKAKSYTQKGRLMRYHDNRLKELENKIEENEFLYKHGIITEIEHTAEKEKLWPEIVSLRNLLTSTAQPLTPNP